MVHEAPELTSSHEHTKYTTTYGTIPSEKRPENQLNSSFTTNNKRVTSRWVGEAETVSPNITIPTPMWQPTTGRDLTNPNLLPEYQVVHASHQSAKPWDLNEEIVSKMSGFEKQQGSCSGEPEGCGELRYFC